MEIVKKNWLSILFGVIAILAVVADFYPMGGMRTKLKEDATANAAVANTLKELRDKPRNLPIVTPGNTEPVPLAGFPTEQAITSARTATELVDKAAKYVTEKAAANNKHDPLVPDALPGQAANPIPASTFAREYLRMFPPPPAGAGVLPVVPPPTPPGQTPTLMELLQAGIPPTDAQLTAARTEKQAEIEQENTAKDSTGAVTNADQVKQMVDNGLRTLNEEMRTDAAKKCLVYVSSDATGTITAFSQYPGMEIKIGVNPEPSQIFWAQVGLWTQQDVCNAIHDLNASSGSVLNAPVKELNKIAFVQGGSTSGESPSPLFVLPGLTSGVAGNGRDAYSPDAQVPGAVSPDAQAAAAPPPAASAEDPTASPLPKNTALSPTGRQSNPAYDAEQFTVDMICDAERVPQVLAGLENGKYLTVINVMSVDTVDSAILRGAGYYFGDKPCVRVKVRCEELFFRSWLGPLTPPRIKAQLNATPAAAAG